MDSKGNKNKEDDIIPTKNKNLVILGTIITVMFASAGYGIYTGVKWIHGKVYPSLFGSIDVIENEEDDDSLNINEVEDPDDSSPETTPESSPEEKEDESQPADTNQLGLDILESDDEEKEDEPAPQNNDPEVVQSAIEQAKVDSEKLVNDLNTERMKLLEEFGDITKNELDEKQNQRLEDYQNTINEINKTLKTGGQYKKNKRKRKTKKNKKKN